MLETVAEWLAYADENKVVADTLLSSPILYKRPYRIICYHAQQQAELYLKALYIHCSGGKIPKKTHNLVELFMEIEEYISVPDGLKQVAGKLSSYAIETRYPSGEELGEVDAKYAISGADKISDWVKSITKD